MEMKIKDWTVGELVAYLTGNQQINKSGIPVLDEWLHSSLQGNKGLVSGTLRIKVNPNCDAKMNGGEETEC